MLRCMLRAKIHGATVTDANIAYEGSVTVDEALLEARRCLDGPLPECPPECIYCQYANDTTEKKTLSAQT